MVIHIPAGPADPCQNRCVGEAVREGAGWGAAPRGSPRDGRNPNLPTPTRMHRTLQTLSPLSSLPYPVAWWMGTPLLAPKTLSALLPSPGLPQRAERGSGVSAAPEGPSRSAGHRLRWKRSPTAALSLRSGKNVTRKAAHPWLCYAAV